MPLRRVTDDAGFIDGKSTEVNLGRREHDGTVGGTEHRQVELASLQEWLGKMGLTRVGFPRLHQLRELVGACRRDNGRVIHVKRRVFPHGLDHQGCQLAGRVEFRTRVGGRPRQAMPTRGYIGPPRGCR